jgi:hypothetical protein
MALPENKPSNFPWLIHNFFPLAIFGWGAISNVIAALRVKPTDMAPQQAEARHGGPTDPLGFMMILGFMMMACNIWLIYG